MELLNNKTLFIGMLDNIDIILNNEFYKDKESLIEVKKHS